jgi:hypothetical protein
VRGVGYDRGEINVQRRDFECRLTRGSARAHAAGVRKAAKHEIAAAGSRTAVPQALWRFGHGLVDQACASAARFQNFGHERAYGRYRTHDF